MIIKPINRRKGQLKTNFAGRGRWAVGLAGALLYSSSDTAQRHDWKHIDVHGIDQLASGRHQFAPEVLVVTAQHQIHVVLLDGVHSTCARSPLPLRVSVIAAAGVLRQLGQRLMGF